MCVHVCIIPKTIEIHKPRASFPFSPVGDSFAQISQKWEREAQYIASAFVPQLLL